MQKKLLHVELRVQRELMLMTSLQWFKATEQTVGLPRRRVNGPGVPTSVSCGALFFLRLEQLSSVFAEYC